MVLLNPWPRPHRVCTQTWHPRETRGLVSQPCSSLEARIVRSRRGQGSFP